VVMDSPVAETIITCAQCGGELHPDEGQSFLTCPYCGSTVYLDKSQVVFHLYLAPTLDEGKARGVLASWMAGNQTVKDLDKKASLLGSAFEYFPLWYFKRRQPDGEETILLEPAAATSVSDLRNYDPALDTQAHPPSVPLEAALSWLAGRGVPADQVAEKMLVHIPLYTFKYGYRGNTYTAVIEAGTGGVFANIYPAKAETPYQLIGGVTALVFLCLATFPLFGAAIQGWTGTGIGLLVAFLLMVVVAPVLFAIAARIASKV
jgi:predicted RNA-binding Zn-ribbon protein involved in translation (DUF1610 family)